MIKVEKYVYLKTADIFIHRINCTPENISKLIDVFEFKNNIEIIADMGFADEESFPFEKIESFKLKHNASFEKNKFSNGFFRLIALSNECQNFLKDSFTFDIEYMAIYSVKDESLLGQNLSYDMCRSLIKQKRLDVFMVITLDESRIVITLNKETYNAKQIAAKIKALFLPKLQ